MLELKLVTHFVADKITDKLLSPEEQKRKEEELKRQKELLNQNTNSNRMDIEAAQRAELLRNNLHKLKASLGQVKNVIEIAADTPEVESSREGNNIRNSTSASIHSLERQLEKTEREGQGGSIDLDGLKQIAVEMKALLFDSSEYLEGVKAAMDAEEWIGASLPDALKKQRSLVQRTLAELRRVQQTLSEFETEELQVTEVTVRSRTSSNRYGTAKIYQFEKLRSDDSLAANQSIPAAPKVS